MSTASSISPWSGRRGARRFPRLAHEHLDLRQAVGSLRLAMGSSSCPPAGHVYFGILGRAAEFLLRELPAHAREEEATLYVELASVTSSEELGALKAEHTGLQFLAVELIGWVRMLLESPPDEARWAGMREVGDRLCRALDLHLTHEEAAIDRSLTGAS